MRASKIAGVSLLEVLLALAIAGSIAVLGFNQYQTFSYDNAAQQVKYNAEEIIRAAAYYYYANCSSSGTLGPSANDPYTVTVSDLVNAGYLQKAPIKNVLVDATQPNGGYFIQFNKYTSPHNYCPSATDDSTCEQIGTNVGWNIQVSVYPKDPKAASRLYKMTGADCQTTLKSGSNEVASCSDAAGYAQGCQDLIAGVQAGDPGAQSVYNFKKCPGTTGGSYNNTLSWERLPSMSSQQGQSVLWLTNPVVKQFKQDNDTQYSLSYMLANPTVTYFVCGS